MQTYTDGKLRNIFQSPFDAEDWNGLLQHFFHANELRQEPEEVESNIGNGSYLGCIDPLTATA